jgi:hypothetical protein
VNEVCLLKLTLVVGFHSNDIHSLLVLFTAHNTLNNDYLKASIVKCESDVDSQVNCCIEEVHDLPRDHHFFSEVNVANSIDAFHVKFELSCAIFLNDALGKMGKVQKLRPIGVRDARVTLKSCRRWDDLWELFEKAEAAEFGLPAYLNLFQTGSPYFVQSNRVVSYVGVPQP